ncbi:hypothetical protein Vadar_024153 [Vaccinium darrowii]|uniref:Uncharacterized protein n=1 Tax=Vaccinium darrowii TaxID=229202 RepID=A0ACB7YPM7_9ERIC|nr:hypothetical protein Vadar_024153 [Vaccinium darrowii]
MLCFNCSCPDFISRYRLSKQAEKKVVRIKHLAEDGSKIGTVSHPVENLLELDHPSSRDYEDFHSRQKAFEGIVDALKNSNVNMIGVYGAGGVVRAMAVRFPASVRSIKPISDLDFGHSAILEHFSGEYQVTSGFAKDPKIHAFEILYHTSVSISLSFLSSTKNGVPRMKHWT